MNTFFKQWKPSLLALAYVLLGTTPVWADDTEIYFGSNQSGVRNNILFVIDTSGSMGGYDGDSTTRLEELKTAFRTLLLGLDNVNVGLMRFSNPGGPVLYPVSNINEAIASSEVDTGVVEKAVASANDDGYEFLVAPPAPSTAVNLGTAQLEMGADAVSGVVSGVVNVQVVNDNDDAESRVADNDNNAIYNDTLDMTSTQTNGTLQQFVGIRFASVNIPVGATVTSAYIQLRERDHGGSAPISIEIAGERVSGGGFDNSDGSTNSVYARYNAAANRTTALTSWTIGSMPVDDATIQTPDVSAIVQESVSNALWAPGNALTFFFRRPATATTTGRIGFRSRDNSSTNQPRLVVNYTVGTASTGSVTTAVRFTDVNIPRHATITSAHLEFVAGASLSGAAEMSIAAELVGDSAALSPATGNITSRAPRTAAVTWSITDPWVGGTTYSTPLLTAAVQSVVNQGGWCGGNAVTFLLEGTLGRRVAEAFENGSGVAPRLVVNYDPASIPADGSSCKQASFVRQVAAGSDDAEEENNTSAADLTSNDLDMAASGSVVRRVGLRFTNIAIPKDASIQSAYLEFRAAGNSNSAVNLTINGQAVDDAPTFASADNNISGRAKTAATVTWSPSAWVDNTTYRSTNVGPIVQELVNRGGWARGNDMVFIIDGSSTTNYRSADSYNGSSGNAPKLIVNYADNGTSGGYTVRDKLIEIVDSLNANGMTPLQDTFYEAIQYYRGQAVDYGRVRGGGPYAYTRVSHPNSMVPGSYTSITPAGCQDSGASGCASETINGSPVYKSPIEYACQANHIVLLTDGLPNSDHSTAKIRGLPGFTTNACSYAGNGECAPELADWVNDIADASSTGTGSANLAGRQSVVVDTIAFYQDADGNEFLEDIAASGGGQYHAAASSADLVTALESITQTTISENASFVSAGAAVNAFNRTLNRDDLYFSVFKPERTPKWPGNLKKYKLDFQGNPLVPVIVDATGTPAVDLATGFFDNSSRSIWSASPDGPDVSRGGAASRITDHATRQIYTNIGASGTLSDAANELVTSNALLTTAAFNALTYSATQLTELIEWTRGRDVRDEDSDSSTTDTRFVMGDPLHSRPVAITYGGTEAAPDITVFVASNDGSLRAIDDDNGNELFAFIPKELLPLQRTLYENVEGTGHAYGLDGSITTWVIDPDGDGVVLDSGGSVQAGNRVILVVGMGRGGRNYYAVDVTNRNQPELLWTINGGTTVGFENLGQSWSQPSKAIINVSGTPVRSLILGGGYDPGQDSTTVRETDSQGNSVYIVNLLTGALVWRAGNGAEYDLNLAAMRYSIPAQVASADVSGDGLTDFFFVGDMGGQVWRFDVHNGASAGGLVSGGVIADLGVAGGANIAANNRRFYHTPELFAGRIGGNPYLGVAIGSGWRGHPLSEDTQDRFYMIRQTAIFSAPAVYTAVTEADLYDASANLIGEGTAAQQATEQALLNSSQGWYISMRVGEKVLSTPLVLNGEILFNTYQPAVSAAANPCIPQTGTNRSYQVFTNDARPSTDRNSDGLTKEDRSIELLVPGIVDGTKVICTADGCARVEGALTSPAGQSAYEGIKRIYWYENRER